MSALETKIPPPIVALLVAAAMYAIAQAGGRLPIAHGTGTALTWLFAGIAVPIIALAMFAFVRAKTTINPVTPEEASAVVETGIFAVTRNPMYLGLTLLLVAWAFRLMSPIAFLGPLVFVLYMTRFQIVPEERALSTKFGEAYDDYRRRVRRWI